MRHILRHELDHISGGYFLWGNYAYDLWGTDASNVSGEDPDSLSSSSSDLTRTDEADRAEILAERIAVNPLGGGYGNAELGPDGTYLVSSSLLPTADQLAFLHNLEILNSWTLGLRGVDAFSEQGVKQAVINAIANALTDYGIDAVKSGLNLNALYNEYKNSTSSTDKTPDQFAQWVRDQLVAQQPDPSGGGGDCGGEQFGIDEEYLGWNFDDLWDDWDISGSNEASVTVGDDDDWWNQLEDWYDDFFEWMYGGSF